MLNIDVWKDVWIQISGWIDIPWPSCIWKWAARIGCNDPNGCPLYPFAIGGESRGSIMLAPESVGPDLESLQTQNASEAARNSPSVAVLPISLAQSSHELLSA